MNGDRIIGFALLTIGLLGYLTVADDLRHVGEFVGVSAITVAGLIFLAASFDHKIARRLLLRWIALGILAGIVIGAALDSMVLGVGIGMASGTFLGIFLGLGNRHATGGKSEE
jgi:hypothetical protein